MSLADKLRKNSTSKLTSMLNDSKVLSNREMTTTSVPILNVALDGSLHGGFTSGLISIAGESRSFKTGISLVLASAYLKKHDDAVILFYDSEFGSPGDYFKASGIDTARVVHTPVTNIEDLKFDIMKQLEGLEREDHIFILIDSIGNLASKKEVDDALDGKSVADMSRAKQLKSFYRMITPHLTLKDIPMVVIQHTYNTIEMYSKPVMSGGTGGMLSSNIVWIITRSQDKDADGLHGYIFNLNIEKSRFVREKSKLPINVDFDKGIKRTTGLLELAIELGAVVKPSMGWYSFVDIETGEAEEKKYRAKQLEDYELWRPLVNNPKFDEMVKKRFRVGQVQLISDEEALNEFKEVDDV